MLVTPAPIRLLQVLACTRFQGNSCRHYGLDGDDDEDDNDDDDDDDDDSDGDDDDTFIQKVNKFSVSAFLQLTYLRKIV